MNARVIAEELKLDVGNVHRYIKPLLDARILAQSLDVTRNQVWRAPEVLAALDAFAARAGRRTSKGVTAVPASRAFAPLELLKRRCMRELPQDRE